MSDNEHIRDLAEQICEQLDDSEVPSQWAVDDYEVGPEYEPDDVAFNHVDSPAFVKYDDQKRRWDLLPWDALSEIVKVLEAGAIKYDDHNWARGCAWSRYWSATMRHVTAWWMGESTDQETGLSHLAHAGCCILFLLAFELRHAGTDDRGGS